MKIHVLLFSAAMATFAAFFTVAAMEKEFQRICVDCSLHHGEPNEVHYACMRGHLDCLDALLCLEEQWIYTKKLMNSPDPITGWTPLHKACIYAKYDVLQRLRKANKINVNAQDIHGLTPLMWACVQVAQMDTIEKWKISLKIFESLIHDYRLDMSILDKGGGSALSYVHAAQKKHGNCADRTYMAEILKIYHATDPIESEWSCTVQ